MYMEVNKQVMGLEAELGSFLEERGFLRTGVLLDNWYVLSNKNLTILVDTIRPRIVQVFAHGSLGTFQMMLYSPRGDWEMGSGLWGIIPVFQLGKLRGGYLPGETELKRFFPLRHSHNPETPASLLPNFPKEVIFDAEGNRLTMRGVTFYEEDGKQSFVVPFLEVQLGGNILKLHVEYPKDAWRTEVLSQWYPLYGRWVDEVEGADGMLNYDEGFQALFSKRVTLIDRHGRMPRVTITSQRHVLQISSRRDYEMKGAFRLDVSAIGKVRVDDISFEFTPNPVTLLLNPQINAGRPQPVIVYSEEKAQLLVDGKKKET
jgi:hypothetical protein